MNLIDIDDFDVPQLYRVLDTAAALKAGERDPPTRLAGKSLGMLFERPSTRTRVSFEVGMTQLGGHAVFLGTDDIQLGRGEPVKDTARALSGYVDAVMARVKSHDSMLELAEYADVPVINGLTSRAHPAQTVADLLTIREHCGFEDATVAWVGDGNNVASSFLVGAAMVGLDVRAATPAGYEFREETLERAREFDGEVTTTRDPITAVEGADVVYTDVWVSMGEEERRAEKVADFAGFQVNEELLAHAPDAAVMHCLPAHRGEEITDDVMESDRELIWAQAENRLHGQKGLLVELL